jgi:ATP-dependent Clp protease ATP-binding subunit ClpA
MRLAFIRFCAPKQPRPAGDLYLDWALTQATAHFDRNSKQILGLAKQEAYRLNHERIAIEHVLVGMVRHPKFAHFMKPAGQLGDIRAKILGPLGEGPDWVTIQPMGATEAVSRLIARAQAISGNSNAVTPEHLWLAFLQGHETEAALLQVMGIDVEASRETIRPKSVTDQSVN